MDKYFHKIMAVNTQETLPQISSLEEFLEGDKDKAGCIRNFKIEFMEPAYFPPQIKRFRNKQEEFEFNFTLKLKYPHSSTTITAQFFNPDKESFFAKIGYELGDGVESEAVQDGLVTLARPGLFDGILSKIEGSYTLEYLCRHEPKQVKDFPLSDVITETGVIENSNRQSDLDFSHLDPAINKICSDNPEKDVYVYKHNSIVVAVAMTRGLVPTKAVYDKEKKVVHSFAEVGLEWVPYKTKEKQQVFCLTSVERCRSSPHILYMINADFFKNKGDEDMNKNVDTYFECLEYTTKRNPFCFWSIHIFKITALNDESFVSACFYMMPLLYSLCRLLLPWLSLLIADHS